MPRTPSNRVAFQTAPPPRLWPMVGGPIVTLATLVGLLALAATQWRIPSAPVIYLVPVVYSAYVGGLGPGMVSAALSLAFALLFFSRPGHPFEYTAEDLQRVLLLAISTPTITLMVGLLRRRE